MLRYSSYCCTAIILDTFSCALLTLQLPKRSTRSSTDLLPLFRSLSSYFDSQLKVAGEIIAKDGFGSLYKGLGAGLLRQATYTTSRMGIFNVLSEQLKTMNGGANIPLWQKAAAGLAAGGLGALVGTPADLALIRMQADTTLPPEQRRNYKGVGDALGR